jgi:hypothetical protein
VPSTRMAAQIFVSGSGTNWIDARSARMADIWILQRTRIGKSRRAWKPPITRKPQSDELAAPLFWMLSANLAAAAGFFLLLYFLHQPTISPNAGVAAYMPPPGTRLIPLPRRSDAPELVDLSADPASALSALAQAQTSDQHAKADAHPPARKRPRADPGEHDQRKVGFGQQWNFGYSGWNNNRSSSSNSRSWF